MDVRHFQLYKKPKLLFLDEATSHLDVKNESSINETVSRLGITTIMVAHRIETIASAHKVYRLTKEGLIDTTATTPNSTYNPHEELTT